MKFALRSDQGSLSELGLLVGDLVLGLRTFGRRDQVASNALVRVKRPVSALYHEVVLLRTSVVNQVFLIFGLHFYIKIKF